MKIVVSRLSGLLLTVFLVIGNAILIEQVLDMYGIRGHRLLTGIVGTLLVILSFAYSMRKIGKKQAVVDLHNRMKGKDCLICHTDHKGPKGKITKVMDHDAFKSSKCLDCHSGEGDKAPKDDMHELGAIGSCGAATAQRHGSLLHITMINISSWIRTTRFHAKNAMIQGVTRNTPA